MSQSRKQKKFQNLFNIKDKLIIIKLLYNFKIFRSTLIKPYLINN